MRYLLDFCVARGLLSREDADRFAAQHERRWEHEIRLITQSGIDERTLYRHFGDDSGLPLIGDPQTAAAHVERMTQGTADWPIPHDYMEQFDSLPFDRTPEELTVATWRWDRRSVIAAALENLGGLPVRLVLMTPSLYDRLVAELAAEGDVRR